MKRIYSFDYIRALSIVGIVLCHCCYGIPGLSLLGKFLGNTFNVLFLILSAFLMGLSWDKKGRCAYKFSFLRHRLGKLAFTYYPFLIIMFAFLVFVGYHIMIKDLMLHLLFLPWFDKLPGFGHLWFITMITFCYIGVFLFTNMPYSLMNFIRTKTGLAISVLFAILSQIVMRSIGMPDYMLLYLIGYILVFVNAGNILHKIKGVELKKSIFTLVFCVILFYLWGG